MLSNPLTTSVFRLKWTKGKYAQALSVLGIETISDLLFYFPFRFDDFSDITPIINIKPQERVTIQGNILEIKNTRTFYRRMTITEALIQDATATIRAIWYNQPFLKQNLKKDTLYRFSGKTKFSKNELFLQSPSFEKNASSLMNELNSPLIPVYHVTQGITPKMLRFFIKQALPFIKFIPDFLPQNIILQQKLLPLQEAIRQIHFPCNKEKMKMARKRLGFNELFLIQLNYQLKKIAWQKNKAPQIPKKLNLLKKIIKTLPFQLTLDQKRALWEIIQNLNQEVPMNRLLEGDVGSGKTIVAILAMLCVAKHNWQAVLMAPTEILAKQHMESLKSFAQKNKISLALLTNSFSLLNDSKTNKTLILKKEKLINHIKLGKVKLIIGTHALIQKNVAFKKLALVVIDEQHRFGVEQRAFLIKKTQKLQDGQKKTIPHLLSMTATPIPRTLALTFYGDLDISLIKEMPKGRKKIITRIVPPNFRNKAYQFLKQEIIKGRQVFVICPLIEDSRLFNSRSVEKEYINLKNTVFPAFSVEFIHGKIKSIEKEKIMNRFTQNQTQILVATSVIEVGINIPNATIMLIEGAERFGLAQLHQFRGRVGRGKHQSYCLLFTESPSPKTWERLKYLEETQNGFELAQKDLKLRGPGEFLGDRQSGFSNLTIASLNDRELIKNTREEAKTLAIQNPALKNLPLLKQQLRNLEKEAHFE